MPCLPLLTKSTKAKKMKPQMNTDKTHHKDTKRGRIAKDFFASSCLRGEIFFGCGRAAPCSSVFICGFVHAFASSVLSAGCGCRPKHRLADHVFRLLDSELCQNSGSHIRERRTLHDSLLVTK